MPLGQQAGKGQRLGIGPVDAFTLLDGVIALVEELLDFRMQGKPVGNLDQLGRQLAQPCRGNRRVDVVGRPILAADLLPFPAEASLGRFCLFFQSLFEPRDNACRQLLDHLRGHPVCNEPLGRDSMHRWPRLDLFHHNRLGEGRLITLVVPLAAIADQL